MKTHATPPPAQSAVDENDEKTTGAQGKESTPPAIVEAELPQLEIMSDMTVIAGNGGLIQYRAGQRVSDRWFVSHALKNNVPHRIVNATEEKAPTAITVLETKYLIIGRGSTTVRHGQVVTDQTMIDAVIRAGIRFTNSSMPDAT